MVDPISVTIITIGIPAVAGIIKKAIEEQGKLQRQEELLEAAAVAGVVGVLGLIGTQVAKSLHKKNKKPIENENNGS